MKFLEKAIKKPAMFQRLFGIPQELFPDFVRKIKPLWEASEMKRLEREYRKRDIGAGHPYSLATMEEKLAAVLLYYKTYPTQELVAYFLGIDQSTVSRLFGRLGRLIEEAADPELKTFLAKAKEAWTGKRISTPEQFFASFPDLKDVATDATGQQCYRSSKYEEQKKYYSGKSKQHEIKMQISTSCSTNRILDVSDSYPGSVHDKKIIDTENTIEKFPELVPHRFDSGYQGIQKEHPNHYLILPIKKRHGCKLSALAKELNAGNSRRRVRAEHANARIKKFKIIDSVFRNPIQSHNWILRGVVALLNFRLAHATQ